MTPSTLQAAFNCSGLKMQLAFPCRYAQCAPVQGNQNCRGLVLRLFQTCGPFAITKLIVSFVVDAFKCHTRWTFTHVRKEQIEIMAPHGMHFDATASILRIGSRFRVVAAGFGGGPALIGSRITSAMFGRFINRYISRDIHNSTWRHALPYCHRVQRTCHNRSEIANRLSMSSADPSRVRPRPGAQSVYRSC